VNTSDKEISRQYVLGLDIGIASTGWAVLNSDDGSTVDGIIDLGVRTFERGETAKEGESLNLARRLARGTRRRLRRRAHRMLRLKRLLLREGMIKHDQLDTSGNIKFSADPWRLRSDGLDRLLTPFEWAEVIYHIIKHRGYLSTRKADKNTSDDDTGKVLVALKAMNERLQNGGWRTIGEMAYKDEVEFGHSIRNKQGDYRHCFDRKMLKKELQLLAVKQREYGNPHTDDAFVGQITTLLMQQRPALSGKNLLKMLGKCTFEKHEYRAPRSSYSAERFVWLTKLNNLRLLNSDRTRRALTAAERRTIIDMPYVRSTVKYAQVRKILDLPDDVLFVGLRYRDDKNAENEKLIELKSWHKLKKMLTDAGLKTEWQGIATRPDELDKLAYALSVFKDDKEITEYLRAEGFDDAIIDALLPVSFSKFSHLSLLALRKLMPHLQAGMRYDEACTAAGYDHSLPVNIDQSELLPPINPEDVRNPVVLRSLTQARKVINAIVREYGQPLRVHIELARDLSRPKSERNRIERDQKKWRDHKEGLVKEYVENLGTEPSGKDLLKYRLYKEQNGKCAYSLQPLILDRLTEAGYADIDHILPYSRTFDDSLNNKVLVLGKENRNKGNKTPWEYFGSSNEPHWLLYEAWVKSNPGFKQAKRNRLLKRSLTAEDQQDFRERHLNDTRYIARYLKNFVEQNLQLSAGAQRVRVVSGSLTSFLRARYGLIKHREESDLHHAMDAVVVAAVTNSMIKRLSDYARFDELEHVKIAGFIDPETREVLDISTLRKLEQQFPNPWPHFRQELEARLKPDPQRALQGIEGWQHRDVSWIRPITVSRAPRRGVTGPGHAETIRSAKRLDEQISYTRVPLSKLTLPMLEKMHGRERDKPLYEALKARLEEHGGKAEKAFAEPFYKPAAPGKQAPRVTAIKIEATQKSGLPIRNGVADATSMVRVDVYRKNSKYCMVPVYAWQIETGEIPVRAVIQGRPKKQWELMDENAEYLYHFQYDDLIEVDTGKSNRFGYFNGLNISTGAIDIETHDLNTQVGKNGVFESVGVKTAKSLKKYQIDVLGRYWQIDKEVPPWAGAAS